MTTRPAITPRATSPKLRLAISLVVSLLALAPSLARADPVFPENLVFVELKSVSQVSIARDPGAAHTLADEGGGFGIGYRYRMFEIGGEIELARGFSFSESRADELRALGFAGVLLPVGRVSWLELRLRLGGYGWANVTDQNGTSLRGGSGTLIGFEPRVSAPLYRDEYIWVRGFLGVSVDLDLGGSFTGASTSAPGGINASLLFGFELSLL